MAERENNKTISMQPSETPKSIAAKLAGLHPADIAAALERSNIDHEMLGRILSELDSDLAADVVIQLDESTVGEILDVLEVPEIAEITTELESDDAADVVGLLDRDKKQKVLAKLEEDDRRTVEALLKYTDESAGGIMASELIFVNSDALVDDAIAFIRASADELEDIHNVYIVERDGRLAGLLSLRELMLAKPGTRVTDVMEPDVVTVSTEMDQEDVARVFRKYDLVAVPVVDPAGRLVGRITVDDIMDVIHEEAEEDISIMAGTRDEELHEDSALKVSWIRLPWLVIGALGGLASASVMSLYSVSLEKVLALAFFIPVITAMGGNVGLQTSTIIVRGMHADGGIDDAAGARLLKEWRIAVTNAVILGAAVLLVVGLWLGDWRLAFVVGGALSTVILVAATLGTIMPFTLRRLGVDPAVAQGPFVTTLNDIIGILVYLGLATLFLDMLNRG
ncbi:MAG: magnesium transporter [Candidatus Eisenbacteria bacterium]|nr:magnesium transporter [Candidatus Eisenbacteria bacterium]